MMSSPENHENALLSSWVKAARNAPFVLLEDRLHRGNARLFTAPTEIISCHTAQTATACLARLDKLQDQGFYLAGFLSYELGYLFEDRLRDKLHAPTSTPLIWFGAFAAPDLLTPAQSDLFLGALRQGDCRIENLTPTMTEPDYTQAIGRIHQLIAAGDSYQVNFTFKHRFDVIGDPTALYQQLRHRQPVSYSALINTGEQQILSLSPELFIQCRNNHLTTRPMKGTTPRGTTPAEDDAHRQFLTCDPKSRAENLMIVDLLRNDIGRVCEVGSVQVTDLFHVERYRSLHQMVSEVTGQRKQGMTSSDLIRALFPCGSITGAPKIRTMDIIHDLEHGPRGLYTGSIGALEPNGDFDFNVAIRTVVIDKDSTTGTARGELGIGSGIVQDSIAADEYRECLLKGRFLSGLTDAPRDFCLIETLLWRAEGGYWLLDDHLNRLQHSAAFFGFAFDQGAIRARLDSLDASGHSEQRVRLLLDKQGQTRLSATALSSFGPKITFVLSGQRINSSDPFFAHKTTHRAFYDDELARCVRETGCDEVVFLNECGDVTEGARTNIFVEQAGRLYTPPLDCGLLNGVLRRHLLRTAYRGLEERRLTAADLYQADQVWLGNSVRGLMAATPIGQIP